MRAVFGILLTTNHPLPRRTQTFAAGCGKQHAGRVHSPDHQSLQIQGLGGGVALGVGCGGGVGHGVAVGDGVGVGVGPA